LISRVSDVKGAIFKTQKSVIFSRESNNSPPRKDKPEGKREVEIIEEEVEQHEKEMTAINEEIEKPIQKKFLSNLGKSNSNIDSSSFAFVPNYLKKQTT